MYSGNDGKVCDIHGREIGMRMHFAQLKRQIVFRQLSESGTAFWDETNRSQKMENANVNYLTR